MVFTVTSSDCKVKKARFYEFLFTLGCGGGGGGDRGAGGVREVGEERAGGGISTMAGSGREIKKVKLFFLLLLTSSQRNEPNNVS